MSLSQTTSPYYRLYKEHLEMKMPQLESGNDLNTLLSFRRLCITLDITGSVDRTIWLSTWTSTYFNYRNKEV
jgi:hypothetical protein